jgi:hypothetical protein
VDGRAFTASPLNQEKGEEGQLEGTCFKLRYFCCWNYGCISCCLSNSETKEVNVWSDCLDGYGFWEFVWLVASHQIAMLL